ncbi:MAG: hypothetical protein KAU27_11750 [Desulfuromonadales bacterium]|nr:hypothetical protein [Desulfuromonadales bacterium]
MFRSSLIALFLLTLAIPSFSFASDNLASLEAVVAASQKVQPGLNNYLATVETSRIEEMMTNLTSGMPADVKPPSPPTIAKFWQRNGKSLVYARQTQLAPYVAKMVKQISANLAIELNEMLLPAAQAEQRRALVKGANIRLSEVALTDNLIHRLEISFKQPTDLNGAFYVSGMRLPQKQIKSLAFDIDAKTNTVRELVLVTDNGLQLTVEIRYLEVTGGHIPERFQVTSPDGKVDDSFEVKFIEVDGFLLPASMLRVIHRPELQEKLEVFFKNYQVNKPIPEDIQARLKSQLTQ